MRIHARPLPTISRYLEREGGKSLDSYGPAFRRILSRISQYRPLPESSRILEVGIGTGWFPILCARHGLSCVGLDISPQLIEHAKRLAAAHHVTLDLRLGNIEDISLPEQFFDVVVAECVFEHVEHWRPGLINVWRFLKPGGLLLFTSTNKFAFRSSEYPLPFYGWLPDRLRYWLRARLEGAEVFSLGLDFNQFTYRGLRRALTDIGFSRTLDPSDFLDPARLNSPSRVKATVITSMRRFSSVRELVLLFSPSTELIAIR